MWLAVGLPRSSIPDHEPPGEDSIRCLPDDVLHAQLVPVGDVVRDDRVTEGGVRQHHVVQREPGRVSPGVGRAGPGAAEGDAAGAGHVGDDRVRGGLGLGPDAPGAVADLGDGAGGRPGGGCGRGRSLPAAAPAASAACGGGLLGGGRGCGPAAALPPRRPPRPPPRPSRPRGLLGLRLDARRRPGPRPAPRGSRPAVRAARRPPAWPSRPAPSMPRASATATDADGSTVAVAGRRSPG